jgi:SAM-dependent methyltransferase
MNELQLCAQGARTARVQGELWSERAADWAEHEVNNRALFEHALQATHVAPGKRLLDVGCGSGFALSRAAARGALVTGLDAAPGLIEIARRRLPAAEVRVGDMEMLPFADESFDVVTGFNAFPYAAAPVRALREAWRVTRRGGLLAAVTWGAAVECQAAAYLEALALLGQAKRDSNGPFAVSAARRLSAVVAEAGWSPLAISDIVVQWHWPDREGMLRALLSSGPVVKAVRQAGLARTRDVVAEALRKFEGPDGYRLQNTFRCLVARR